jgi:UDP-N-acetylglucosamine 1-carboxyvinyltransferase
MKDSITAYIQGGQPPQGHVRVSGAKNAATRLLAAATVADAPVTLTNFPTELVDARYKMDFIKKCGGTVTVDQAAQAVTIDPTDYQHTELDDYDYPIRTTYLMASGQLKRSGVARIPYPGGSKIGNRGYDLHVMVWEQLGATVQEAADYIEISAPHGLRAGEVNFPTSTIGGTENALISASTIDGETIIRNAYISPEVDCLIRFLRTLGAAIEVVGNSYVRVTGAASLRGSNFRVIPDRIEALTWIVYGIISGGRITVEDVPFDIMEIPLIHLQHMGIDLYRNRNSVVVSPECLVNGQIQPFELACGTHPGIISDMQPFYTLLGLHANGTSRIYDYRYPERLRYCTELNKFYGDALSFKPGAITVQGGQQPIAAEAESTDLRGSMAAVIAGLLAKGTTTIHNVEMALRGYNNMEQKLTELGASVYVTSTPALADA